MLPMVTRMGMVMFATVRSASLALLALGFLAEPAHAIPAGTGLGILNAPPHARRMAEGAITRAPHAFDTYCDDYGDQCAADGVAEPVHLDAARWSELVEVNRAVNRHIRPQNDVPGADVWTVGADVGDCDDYAVEKRKELADRGWPTAALSLAVAFLRDGEGHLVLTVRTDRGDFVLDNLEAAVKPADRVGYRWVARQSALHPRLWVRVNGMGDDPVLVAEAQARKAERVVVAAKAPAPAPAQAPVAAAPAVVTPVVARDADIEAKIPMIDFSALADLFDPIVVGTVPGPATSATR